MEGGRESWGRRESGEEMDGRREGGKVVYVCMCVWCTLWVRYESEGGVGHILRTLKRVMGVRHHRSDLGSQGWYVRVSQFLGLTYAKLCVLADNTSQS